jgi:hypothetical protein
MHKGKQTTKGVRAADLFPRIKYEEEEEKDQANIALWERHIQQEALHNASNTEGPLALWSKEALLKQLAEQVTRHAQEKYDRAIQREQELMMIGSYD